MSQLEQKLTEMLTAPVEALGFEMVGVEFLRAGKHSSLRIFIDHPDGISVEHCAEVSRQASAVLDVEDPISSEFNLEVSSPGLDRPLFDKPHYEAVVGEIIEAKLSIPLNGRRKFKGVLVAIENDTLVVTVDGEDYDLVLSNIIKAHLVFNHNKKK